MAIQTTKELLDGCVLSILSKKDSYGYNLTQTIKTELNISESTLYPIVRRLQKEQYLTTYDLEYNGRNRRYYKITEKGFKKLYTTISDWNTFKLKINIFLGGNNNE